MTLKRKTLTLTLTPTQCDEISILFDEVVNNKNIDVDDLDEYFAIIDGELSDTLVDFFIEEVEEISWFNYALHAELILDDIETYVEFYKDDVDFVDDSEWDDHYDGVDREDDDEDENSL